MTQKKKELPYLERDISWMYFNRLCSFLPTKPMARRIYHPPPSRNNILWQGVTRPPPPQKKLDSVCVKQRFYGELSNVPRPSAMRIKRTWNPIVPLLGLYAINPLQLAGINLFQICLVSYSQVTFLFLLRINLILVLTFAEKNTIFHILVF